MRALVVEQEAGQRLGQLGLADAGRAEEHERADRPVRILQPGARAAHRLRDGLHRLALADDALAELVFHAQQLVALAFQHLVDRNAGPARDDLGDVVRASPPPRPCRPCRPAASASFSFFSSSGNRAIGKLAGALEFALALGDGELVARLVELLLEVGGKAELLLLGLPAWR